jgi:hypothetical protein
MGSIPYNKQVCCVCGKGLLDLERYNPLNPRGYCTPCWTRDLDHKQNVQGFKMHMATFFRVGGTPEDVLSVLDELKTEQILEE